MKRLLLLATALATCAFPQSAKPFLGRWDLTLTSPRGAWPQWMEIVEKDGKLDGRIQPRGGAVRPIVSAKLDGSHLLITVSTATQRAPEVNWDLTSEGGKISGTQKQGENSDTSMVGVRAPELKKPMPAAWTAPESLFNGKDLAGWEPVNNPANSHWVVKDGTLFNEARGSNIRTTRTFQDFKLHIEVLCPEHCNSGIYLRGRHEIQVGTEGGTQPSHEMGAIYGYFAPKIDMPLGSGDWQTFDITLVGRYVTVVRNGKTIHDNQEIPGITGGALDSNEGEPGPFFLQGDHDGGMAYRNITISVPKK
jgi:3-keto-disaccharide hydrolase